MSQTIYERIYERLVALGIDPTHVPEYARSESQGFMDLNLDRLETTHYQEVYPEPGKVYPKVKRELNQFLAQWLKNCLDQGHTFKGEEEAHHAAS